MYWYHLDFFFFVCRLHHSSLCVFSLKWPSCGIRVTRKTDSMMEQHPSVQASTLDFQCKYSSSILLEQHFFKIISAFSYWYSLDTRKLKNEKWGLQSTGISSLINYRGHGIAFISMQEMNIILSFNFPNVQSY